MNFTSDDHAEFAKLKRDVERYPRQSGYYITKRVVLPDLPSDLRGADALLDPLFQHFDDQEWPPASQRPVDQTWADYECSAAAARHHVLDALVGGTRIGHTQPTMSQSTAADLWDRFNALFPPPRRYFIGMGLGDGRYVYQHGVAVIGAGAAGILWIVEND